LPSQFSAVVVFTWYTSHSEPSGAVKKVIEPGPYTPAASLRWNTHWFMLVHDEGFVRSDPSVAHIIPTQ
jgi:hypothetical protein